MLTDKQVKSIRSMNSTMNAKEIRKADEEWNEAVKMILNSGKDLSNIKLIPKGII